MKYLNDTMMEGIAGGAPTPGQDHGDGYLGNGRAPIFLAGNMLTQNLNVVTSSPHALTWKGDSDGVFDLHVIPSNANVT